MNTETLEGDLAISLPRAASLPAYLHVPVHILTLLFCYDTNGVKFHGGFSIQYLLYCGLTKGSNSYSRTKVSCICNTDLVANTPTSAYASLKQFLWNSARKIWRPSVDPIQHTDEADTASDPPGYAYTDGRSRPL